MHALPPGWAIASAHDIVCVQPHDGWIDAWRLDQLGRHPAELRLDDEGWLRRGTPFDDVSPMPLVSSVSERLAKIRLSLLQRLQSRQGPRYGDDCSTLLPSAGPQGAMVRFGSSTGLHRVDESGTGVTLLLRGSSDLCMPLGPFALAFPCIRDLLPSVLDEFTKDELQLAVERICDQMEATHHRLLIEDAHLLDPMSWALVLRLAHSTNPNHVSIIVSGDAKNTDLRWLDFRSRLAAAGLEPLALSA